MLVFVLPSTSDDRPSNPSDESQPKCKKDPLSHQKKKCSFFGLHSTSDDQPSYLSDKSQAKCKKRPPKSSKNERLATFPIFSHQSGSE